LVNPRVWVRVRVGVRVRVILIATHRVEPALIPIKHRWVKSCLHHSEPQRIT